MISPAPPQKSRLDPDDPRLRARIRARILEARAADWRPWVLAWGITGALNGLPFVGSDGRGWKAVPALCLVGVLCGLAVWRVARNPAATRPRPAARPQTFVQQLIDLCLLLLIAPLAFVGIVATLWGAYLFFLKLL